MNFFRFFVQYFFIFVKIAQKLVASIWIFAIQTYEFFVHVAQEPFVQIAQKLAIANDQLVVVNRAYWGLLAIANGQRPLGPQSLAPIILWAIRLYAIILWAIILCSIKLNTI